MLWKILSLDPSGDFSQKGKGHTGIIYIEYDKDNKTLVKAIPKTLKAKKYESKQKYYKAILNAIKKIPYTFLIIEDYRAVLANATTETSELIGVIEYYEPEIFKQKNSEIKQARFSNDNLIARGIIKKEKRGYVINGRGLDGHARDALRHALKFICKGTGHALKEMEVSWKIQKKR